MLKSKNGYLKIRCCLQLIASLFVLKSKNGYLEIQCCLWLIPSLLMFKSKNGCLKIQFCLQLIPSLFVLKSDTGYLKIQSCYYRIPGLFILKSRSEFIKNHVCKILHPNLDCHISSMVFHNFPGLDKYKIQTGNQTWKNCIFSRFGLLKKSKQKTSKIQLKSYLEIWDFFQCVQRVIRKITARHIRYIKLNLR